jgi:hypothetical protein
MAMRCEAAPIPHQVDVGQGHEGRQLLQEFQRGEPNAHGAVRPRVGERVDKIAVGVVRQPLQGHGTTGGIADELFQLIAAMRRNCRVGVQRKAIDTGAVRPRKPWRLAFRAKARADAAHRLSGSFPTRDTVLDRRGHGAGERGLVVAQGVISGGHRRLQARLQIPQPTQHADDAPADLLDHCSDVRVRRWLALEKAGWATLVGAIKKHPLQEEQVIVDVELEGTAKELDKRDRTRVDLQPLHTALDCLVDVILCNGPADDRMGFGSEVLRRRHPVPQRDRYRDDPLAGCDLGDDALNEVCGRLGHAPGCA